MRFTCPACRQPLSVPEEKAGQKIHCLHCGQRLRAPLAGATPIDEAAGGTPPVRRGREGVEVEPCPTCRAVFRVPAASVGRWVECPKCGTGFCASAACGSAPARGVGEDESREEQWSHSFACPYCSSDAIPVTRGRTKDTAWVIVVILALGCCTLPICWVPLLLMREEVRTCGNCGSPLGVG